MGEPFRVDVTLPRSVIPFRDWDALKFLKRATRKGTRCRHSLIHVQNRGNLWVASDTYRVHFIESSDFLSSCGVSDGDYEMWQSADGVTFRRSKRCKDLPNFPNLIPQNLKSYGNLNVPPEFRASEITRRTGLLVNSKQAAEAVPKRRSSILYKSKETLVIKTINNESRCIAVLGSTT